jgi:ABC-2 type transport system ATP-binding protein
MRKENGTTVFLTTHYIDEAENVDNVCVINHGKIILSGTPDEMKSRLLHKELIVDSDDRDALIGELKALGLEPVAQTHITVPFDSPTPMDILSKLKTPLTVMKVHEPSLEDAYVSLVGEKGGEIQ